MTNVKRSFSFGRRKKPPPAADGAQTSRAGSSQPGTPQGDGLVVGFPGRGGAAGSPGKASSMEVEKKVKRSFSFNASRTKAKTFAQNQDYCRYLMHNHFK